MNDIPCIYGDPTYPRHPHLMAPFKVARIIPIENELDKRKSTVRTLVDFWWIFSGLVDFWRQTILNSLTFKKDQNSGSACWKNVHGLCFDVQC